MLTGLRRRAGSVPFAGPIVTVAEEVRPLGSADPADFGIDRILAGAWAGDVVLIQQIGAPAASAIGSLARRDGVVLSADRVDEL